MKENTVEPAEIKINTEIPVWYKSHRLFALIVLMLTILVVWIFW
jgi:hypothetical protein